MKYFITLSFLVAMSYTAQSQWWFDAGVKGAFGPTLMYDDNVFDEGATSYKHKLTTGHAFGARLGANYGYHVGVALEYSNATSRQDFVLNSDPYNTFKWKHNDIVAVFRYSGNGAYVELGGKLSNIAKVEVDNVNTGVSDVSDRFVDSYTSGIFGFGSYLAGSDVLTLNMGIRLHWGFNEMVSDAGKEQNYPLIIKPLKDPSKKTLGTAAQLQMELNYAFGRFAKTACGDRWKLILFK